jgi:acetyl esterase/lipase
MSRESLGQAERDAAYDNARAVPNSPALRAAREAASAAYRAANPAGLDIAYGPSPRQKWDLFPASRGDSPCLVFIHGGYWQMNTREYFACLAAGIAGHGWSVALPGYTLAPEATLTEIVGEIDAALDWLASNGAAHGIAGTVVVSGWSAGGHLAAMALKHPCVSAGLAISGIFHLAPLRDTYLDHKLNLTDEQIRSCSPIRLPVVEKPMIIAYGTDELPALIGQSTAFHACRAEFGAPGDLVPVEDANHFTILDALGASDGILTRRLLELAP